MKPHEGAVEEEGSCTQLREGEESSAAVPGEPRGPAARRNSTLHGWKDKSTRPKFLLAVGLTLLAVGAALVATPLTLRHALRRPAHAAATDAAATSADPAAFVNEEGVPLDALPAAQQEGELVDCQVELSDRAAYVAAAEAAEQALMGAAAADLPPDQLQQAVDQLPPLLFGTVFWVLVSKEHPWTPAFSTAAAAQVEVLNAAFAGLNMRFRMDAVVTAPAPDDDAILQCSARLPQLAQQLLPPQPPGTAAAAAGWGAGAADPRAIHVVVCEPEGVNGATAVLGPGAEAAGDVIVLRRSALWQSHTSLVHQLGHFFGLAHPFPHERATCKLDGDAIADTPHQYASNQGCDADSDMHVCLDAEGPVPIANFMDLTNDTCRHHFTLGQAARMQSMLWAHRPQLYGAAAAVPPPQQQPLTLQGAWQSGPPPLATQQQQAAAAMQAAAEAAEAAASAGAAAAASAAAAGATGGGSGTEAAAAGQPAVTTTVLYADPWQQAALAADGQLSTALRDCACLGADAAGRVSWTGQLNASYLVDAVRLLLPAQPGGDGGSSLGAEQGQVESQAAPGDTEAAAAAAAADLAAAAGADLADTESGIELDIRVGDSLDHLQNQRCTPGGSSNSSVVLLQQQPLQDVRCDPAVAGRFVTVALAATGEAAQRQLAQRQVCLCEVQPLTAVAPALPAAPPAAVPPPVTAQDDGVTSSGSSWRPLPAVPLRVSASVVASQSSTSSSGAAAAAALASKAVTLGGMGGQQCSGTGIAKAPWWSLDTGLDGLWVRGLRLSVPFACAPTPHIAGAPPSSSSSSGPAALEAGCQPAAAANLTIYVGDVPPPLAAGGVAGGGGTGSLCAAGVAALGGQPLEVDCGRFLQGRYITVVAAAEAQPAALALCGVQLLGAAELAPDEHMLRPGAAADGAPWTVAPASLQPYFTLPIDGDSSSCLVSPTAAAGNSSDSASWQLQLAGSYPLLSVRLTAAAAANGSLAVSLLDVAGGVAASWLTPTPPPAAAAGGATGSRSNTAAGAAGSSSPSDGFVTFELPGATHAAAVRVEGFASLCEVQLLAASGQPADSYLLHPLPPGVNASRGASSSGTPAPVVWQVLNAASASAAVGFTTSGSSSSTNSSSGSSKGLLFDGDYRTCVTAQPLAASASGMQQAAAVEIVLDGPYRLVAVQLVAGGARPQNLSIASVPPGGVQADFAAAWAAASVCQPLVTLQPWQPATIACFQGPPVTDRLLLQLVPSTGPAAAAATDENDVGEAAAASGRLTLCELALYGLPVVPPA